VRGRIGEVTESSSRSYKMARGSATESAAIFGILQTGNWSVPKALLRLGSFWYASFKCSRE
jgi:hypothetical protein